MGKLISLIHVSLDGYMASQNGGMDWITFDAELNQYVTEVRRNVDATVYGRITYQMMEGYWPSLLNKPEGSDPSVNYAHWVNKILKVVVSRSLEEVTWNNTKLIKTNVAAEISKLKKELTGDQLLLGSGTLHQTLMEAGLIDELRLTVNPVVLGNGMPLFKERVNLQLLDTRNFKCGVVGLHYKTIPAGA